MLLLRRSHDTKLTSTSGAASSAAAMNALISHSRVGRPRLWVVLCSGAIEGALEGVPINVLPPEEDAGDGGGDCGRVTFGNAPVESKDPPGAGARSRGGRVSCSSR